MYLKDQVIENVELFEKAYEEVKIKKLVPKDGRQPIPRREHSATLMKGGKYLVIYGGKNDNSADLDSKLFTALDDLMLYDFETKMWSCIG
jgi:hypothetical protein